MINNLPFDAIEGTACIITGGLLNTIKAKTAHGLIRQSDRFKILGVIDEVSAGQDAGEVLDGNNRAIPVFDSILALTQSTDKPQYAIIGMTAKGGILPKEFYPTIKDCLKMGISIINGLHEVLGEIEEFASITKLNGGNIYDIRKPRSFKELHFWTGKIKEVKSLKIGLLGTDCAMGKRTSSKLLVNALIKENIRAHMVYTGQTGWLQGGKYGFIFDATPNDFISGELEHAVYECWENEKSEVIILEGQSSLRNPCGPCGSEFIISCELDAVVLMHAPGRKYYKDLVEYGKEIPDVSSELELLKMYGVETIAIGINTMGLTKEQALEAKEEISKETGLPVILPLDDGMSTIVEIIKQRLK
ncbi:DUF1611 domain-containing protein [Fulvivirga lutimaris]|uniref:DUF1611 domain-containing protein n=1 Tax=Fulvivirga lutimaris TaxID=1819566 RepID=UPI0012BCD2A7|nr:DUF1611 domain-containing protein [Fulvivirga lutimaris]MTI39991.1 DUF1611 domain-containing protein [Fulvivirga lutimaris]